MLQPLSHNNFALNLLFSNSLTSQTHANKEKGITIKVFWGVCAYMYQFSAVLTATQAIVLLSM